MKDFKKYVLRKKISSRGGGLEISLNHLGKQYKNEKMTAYQNYLGGGLLGAVLNDCTVQNWRQDSKLLKTAEDLKRYFHSLTNPDSEYKSTTYEQNQKLPGSAY